MHLQGQKRAVKGLRAGDVFGEVNGPSCTCAYVLPDLLAPRLHSPKIVCHRWQHLCIMHHAAQLHHSTQMLACGMATVCAALALQVALLTKAPRQADCVAATP